MSPSTSRRRRGATIAAAAAALVAAPVAGANAAAPVTDLQTSVLKITGRTFGAGSTIPAGLTLTPATLTTSDPDVGSTDGVILNGGEAVTESIDGVRVATTWSAPRGVLLQTNAGVVRGLAQVVGSNTYVIPSINVPIGAATRTIAPSAVNVPAATSVVTYTYGFVPQGTRARPGRAFVESLYASTVLSADDAGFLIYDRDDVRANADSPNDELLIGDLGGQPSSGFIDWIPPTSGTEVVVTLRLADGRFVVADAVRYTVFSSYGSSRRYYFFEAADLAAAGAGVADVAAVVSTGPQSNDLTWSQLGFAG